MASLNERSKANKGAPFEIVQYFSLYTYILSQMFECAVEYVYEKNAGAIILTEQAAAAYTICLCENC